MKTDKADVKSPESRSATASWSGYNYQGRVGIYVALRKINELLSGSGGLSEFLLEYECKPQ